MSERPGSLVSLYLATQPLLLNVIGLPAMAFIVRSQGEDNYGQWQTAMTITGTLGVLSHLGLRPYFIRAVAQEPSSVGPRLAEQMGLRLLLAVLGAVLSVVACVALGYSRLVLLCTLVAALANIVTSAGYVLADALEGLERFLAYTNAAFASGLALTFASVAVCLLGQGPVMLSFAYLLGPVVGVVAMAASVHRHTPLRITWDWQRYRVLLREARLQSRAVIFGAFEDRAEPLLLPKVTGYADTGYFAAGNIPASRLVAVPNGLSSFYFPKLARRHGEGRNLDETVTHLLTLLLLLTLPSTLGIAFLSDWISGILFPAHPDLCATVMRLTAWSLPLAALGSGMMTALQASGRIDHTARVELYIIVLGVLVTIAFVTPFGVKGAALSWLIRAALVPVLLLPLFWAPFHRGLLRVPWLRLAAACAAMQGVFVLAPRLSSSPLATLLGGAVLGSLVFLGLLAVMGVLTRRQISLMLAGGSDDAP
jgi:O-antigen/teichoic acid export membrane protein